MTSRSEPWYERARRDAVLAGDAAVWAGWVEELFDRVAGYVRWRCGGVSDLADDVLQETWLTAAARLAAFDPDRGPFEAWVCGIAANVVRNQLRSRHRHSRRHRPLADCNAPAGPDDVRERVAAALAALPDRYEQVLRAKYLDGLSVAAIAARRSETEKAVESLLTRARQAFRDAFDGNREGES
jgi:RNA polymerase sigma-70 factor (ECF subfamily)